MWMAWWQFGRVTICDICLEKSQIIFTLAHWCINIFGADYRHNGQRRKLKQIVVIAWNYKEMLDLTLLEWSIIYMCVYIYKQN